MIINVTGGSDLSLIEVSEASAIIQEAAHEEANIIFGAVVDPKMEGRVKITVIATGFGSPAAARHTAPSAAQTPVDMSQYADVGRLRADASAPFAAAVERATATQRLSIARRPAFDLPLSPSPATADSAAQSAVDSEVETSSPFDVPAFLRRQEG